MRFERIKIRSLGPFADVDVDLNALPGCLTAVCGANGAGKSTFVELLAGGLFRECATRGTLASLATARDGLVEVTVTNGTRHTVRQLVDGVSSKGETLILDAAGEPVLEGAKVSTADRWIAEHLPSATTLYNSSIAVQGRRGFLDLGKSERKALLVELLDLRRFERMAAEARERAAQEKGALALLRDRLTALPSPDLEGLRAAHATAEQRVSEATTALALSRRALERARTVAGDAARAIELAEQRQAAEGRRAAASKQVADIESRLANNREVLARGAEIRAAKARHDDLQLELQAAREAVTAAQRKADAAERDNRSAAEAHGRALDETRRLQDRVEQAARRLSDRDAVLKAVADLDGLRALESELAGKQNAARAAIAQLSELLLKGKDQRISGLRDALGEICGGDGRDERDQAYEALTQDDAMVAAQAEAPALLNAAKNDEDLARNQLDAIRKKLAAAERLAARAAEMDRAEVDHADAKDEYGASIGKHLALEEACKAAGAAAAAAVSALAARNAELATIAAALASLQPLLAQATRLDQAQARIEELSVQLESARLALSSAERELATLPVVSAEAVDLDAYERQVATCESTVASMQATHTRAADAIAAGEEAARRRAELLDSIATSESMLADWTRLTQDLGKEGLQAMEIDAALPEVTAIANQLLHEAFGTRFTVDLRTDRLSSDGKRVLEDLEVVVIDTVNGREAPADTYSGGELVIVGSAISLALTTLACRRAGSDAPTLILDEAGAALDGENGRAWVTMLRRAVKMIGASRCLYISHSPELQQLADSQIRIADGKVVVS